MPAPLLLARAHLEKVPVTARAPPSRPAREGGARAAHLGRHRLDPPATVAVAARAHRAQGVLARGRVGRQRALVRVGLWSRGGVGWGWGRGRDRGGGRGRGGCGGRGGVRVGVEVRVGVAVRGRGAAGGAPAARAASSAARRPSSRLAAPCVAPAADARLASCPRSLQSNLPRAACLADTLSGAAAGAVPLPLLRSCLPAAAALLATACRPRRSAKSSSSFWLRMFSRGSQLVGVGYACQREGTWGNSLTYHSPTTSSTCYHLLTTRRRTCCTRARSPPSSLGTPPPSRRRRPPRSGRLVRAARVVGVVRVVRVV